MFFEINKYRDVKSDLSGQFKGIVRSNSDPDKQGGVKCWVKSKLEGTVVQLPWAFPLNSFGLGGSPDSSGFGVPEVGSELIIVFPTRDPYFPQYIGYWQSEKTHQTLFDTEYPNEYGFIDSFVSWVRSNKVKGMMEVFNQLRALVQITEDGDIRINVPRDLVINMEEEGFYLKVNGDLQISVEGDYAIKAQNIGEEATAIHRTAGTQIHHNKTGVMTPTPTEVDAKVDDIEAYVDELMTIADQIKTAGQQQKTDNIEEAGG